MRRKPRKWGQSWSDWDEADTEHKRPIRSKRENALDEIVWKLLLEEEEIEPSTAEPANDATTATGTVVSVQSGACLVADGDREIDCILSPELARRQQSGLAVGDRVSYGVGRGEEIVVMQVHPRKSVLSRPDPFLKERERLIASNVDVVVIVGSIHAPPLQTRLIDRYLIAIQRGGATSIICVNKIDLFEGMAARAEGLKKLEPYQAIGIQTFAVSAACGDGVDPFLSAIRGLRCVFVGKSGVGKSSLLNAIAPELNLRTQEFSEATFKGKHTTTRSDLYRLDGGTEIIDTPGVRSFGLWEIRKDDLRWYFPEFEEHLGGCRFRDCSHRDEPCCAVRAAVEQGEVAAARYDTYRRILATLGG